MSAEELELPIEQSLGDDRNDLYGDSKLLVNDRMIEDFWRKLAKIAK